MLPTCNKIIATLHFSLSLFVHFIFKEKSNRLHQERSNYKEHIDRLQEQIEDLVKERIHLEAELGFLNKQNEQLRQEIVIILEDNDNLEHELGGLEDVFGRQEKELVSATEETKALLR